MRVERIIINRALQHRAEVRLRYGRGAMMTLTLCTSSSPIALAWLTRNVSRHQQRNVRFVKLIISRIIGRVNVSLGFFTSGASRLFLTTARWFTCSRSP